MYGPGRCKRDLVDGDVASLAAKMAMLMQWARAKHPRTCQFDGTWSPMALLYFGPKAAAAAGSGDAPQGAVVLLLYAEFGPNVLVACHNKHLPVKPGDTIEMDLSLDTIITHADLQR